MAKTNSGLLEFKDAQKVLIALDDATSEVKKAVVIDADGTETDIIGSDITVEALSVTENGTYSEEGKAYSPVVVDVAGGSSDFSTAEVTVINENNDGVWMFYLPFIYNYDNLALIGVKGVAEANETKTFDAALAAGGCDFEMEPSFNGILAVTGDAQQYGNTVAITGDCTITIS